ncbi:hypothetical protein MPTK1_3g07680 [Marchantia polymorpha subsp. ruderalis]|uniref:Uncharacterized protein n=2 Tax=Marchantia polymorpha TaxID=3197 RepID=A0AAF6AYG2_MARPO|nr:hypothetical protein MARPO_0006s0244 [Marchantia polymorpha]BBN04796.1 hypothetical protein Mp_3g07680 [Marchantia polymorpha subsp. ruderalis]|eukprot:PTQ48243.1 hypothetical protein MARPO_0006s0244 [Marchantia polymorpha]
MSANRCDSDERWRLDQDGTTTHVDEIDESRSLPKASMEKVVISVRYRTGVIKATVLVGMVQIRLVRSKSADFGRK